MYKVVGVGHSCLDHICQIEAYPPENASTHIIDMELQGGGAVATALVACSRLGTAASFIGVVGDDATGGRILEEFARDGVDCSAVQILPGLTSLASYVMVNPRNGSRSKFPVKDRSPAISWHENQRRMIAGASILHLDGTHPENAWTAMEIAKAARVPVSLDGCSLRDDPRANRRLAEKADVLIMNQKYPLAVSGHDNISDALSEISTWGPKIVMSTQGADGVLLFHDHQLWHYPASQVNVCDTTGAGDVFHGAFLHAYLHQFSLDHAIRFAQFVAAKKCEHAGGRKGIPGPEATQSFLDHAGKACKY